MTEFCSRDLTSIRLKEPSSNLPDVVIASAYLPGDADIPTPELAALAHHCEREGLELIISADTNAHHALWGSRSNNRRGEEFVSFLLSTNLNIINVGSEPTFVTSRAQTIIDLTLASEHASQHISNWHVSNEASCSDHRWIKFNFEMKLKLPDPRRNPRTMDRKRYEHLTAENLRSINPTYATGTVKDIDSHVVNLTQTLIDCFEQTCPLSTPRTGPQNKHQWWGPELERLRRKVRKLFNKAKNSRLDQHWDAYTRARQQYKKRIRTRKTECWRNFCTNIENNNQANRVKSILCSRGEHNLGSLKKPDGKYTKTDSEASELLLKTHFPGCRISDVMEKWEDRWENPPDDTDWDTARKVVTHDKLRWAINSFLPFKAPGLDGVFPGLLRWCDTTLLDHLIKIYRGCLAHQYIPLKWREVKVVFIPKPGKGDYTQPKSHRPISLTSFLLKVLERLIDREIRETALVSHPLHLNQHAYSMGKSTESALHRVVSYIEDNLNHQRSTLATFIDIEGAFDKTNFTSISQALSRHGVDSTISGWIDSMLRYRAIQFTVSEVTRGVVARGCPQGGVLSPLLWNIVVDELIAQLNDQRFLTIGYADDLTILISAPFESITCDQMRLALKIVEQWCAAHNLTVNPSKTEMIMFTNKRSLGNLRLPKLFGTQLTLTKEVKYLGVILDSKLLWNKHLDEKLNKACIIFCQCKRLLGKSWGLSPKITLWLYRTVIRPIITYGAVVWWQRTELSTVINKLQQFQRLPCSAVTGCMRTTPTAALEVALGLPPLDLFIQQEAAMAIIRLKHLGLWHKREGSHSKLWDQLVEYEPLIAAPCDRIPKHHIFTRRYYIQIHGNDRDQSGINEVRIYTDGSKTRSGTGAGVFSQDLNINISLALGQHSSIFQCECVAITYAATTAMSRGIKDYNIRIISDSMAVLKALEGNTMTSGVVLECHQALEQLAIFNGVLLQWIKGHSNSHGNDAADELARRGSATPTSGPTPLLPISFNQIRCWVRQRTCEAHNRRWKNSPGCRQSKLVLNQVTPRLTCRLISLSRPEIKMVVGTITGHLALNRQLFIVNATDSPLCRGCLEAEETAAHVVLECEGVAPQRANIIPDIKSLLEACERPRRLLRFWKELGWLT
ncbi:unnamed protein product [Arctia plantaginis]|uniref:Reverse transcriptase n=1 Tax=Arctia plantaginis TaxID=874455 RepID=A0A8S1ABC7_ARCPL|nr:unnamed protein product [Arctia plantaginis]